MGPATGGSRCEPEPTWPGEPGMGGHYTNAECAALMEVFREMGSWTTSYERRHQEAFETEFASHAGAAHAVVVNSGGVALDLAVAALDAEPGDEVISCAINFPGTHLSVLGAGLRLVLAEPNPVTLNLDPADIAHRMTRRTVAVLVTHMNGLPADLAAIGRTTGERATELGIAGPRLIVDAARALGAATPTGPVGSEGWVTIFSFHRKKAMTTLGEGGMLTTGCAATARRLRQMRSFGDRECWGSSYRMTEFQAAVGQVQLQRLDSMNDTRIALAHARNNMLANHPGCADGLLLPIEPAGYRHVYYLYNLLLSPAQAASLAPGARGRLRERLHQVHRVGTVVANPPTYFTHRFIRTSTAGQAPLPVAEDVADRLLCLPVHPLITQQENTRIAEAVAESLGTLGQT